MRRRKTVNRLSKATGLPLTPEMDEALDLASKEVQRIKCVIIRHAVLESLRTGHYKTLAVEDNALLEMMAKSKATLDGKLEQLTKEVEVEKVVADLYNPSDVQPILWDIKTTARKLSICMKTVRRMLESEELPFVKVRGSVRIPVKAVEELQIKQ